ncbi:hypothetical protein ON010_g12574 [Phytophthora cinnamomi]|nr:hypothetical protein ON010_g12574 [Phytophthora cinnamomi]
MLVSRTIGLAAFAIAAYGQCTTAQQPGTNIPEKHPALASQVCTKVTNVLAQVDQLDSNVVSCVTEKSSVVIDANWRQMNAVGTNNSCNANNDWNATTCSTPKECAKICGLEGADYAGKHSITTVGKTLNMKLETPGGVGTRVYMLDASGKKYKQFQLLNQEFTFDVDMSSLPCGSNGALYFSKMDADGGTTLHERGQVHQRRGQL